MLLRRSEFLFWTLALLIAPWASYGAFIALAGASRGDRPLIVAFAAFGLALWLALGGGIPWRLAWASRAAISPLRLWINRGWRSTYAIADEPICQGAHRVWVSRALRADTRRDVARLGEALSLIEAVQPSRAARLERLAIQFAIAPIHGYAGYLQGTNLILIDPIALAEPVEALASIIVHESNHALLDTRHLLQPLLWERVEHLARIDQWHFGRRLFLSGRVEAVPRIGEIVRGAMRTDNSLSTRWKGVRAGVARLLEGLERNDA